VASGPTYEYVGFSSATVLAIFGFAGMADACQADFGPGSRIATSVEVMAAANYQPQDGEAWVQPVAVALGDNARILDASGII